MTDGPDGPAMAEAYFAALDAQDPRMDGRVLRRLLNRAEPSYMRAIQAQKISGAMTTLTLAKNRLGAQNIKPGQWVMSPRTRWALDSMRGEHGVPFFHEELEHDTLLGLPMGATLLLDPRHDVWLFPEDLRLALARPGACVRITDIPWGADTEHWRGDDASLRVMLCRGNPGALQRLMGLGRNYLEIILQMGLSDEEIWDAPLTNQPPKHRPEMMFEMALENWDGSRLYNKRDPLG